MAKLLFDLIQKKKVIKLITSSRLKNNFRMLLIDCSITEPTRF